MIICPLKKNAAYQCKASFAHYECAAVLNVCVESEALFNSNNGRESVGFVIV